MFFEFVMIVIAPLLYIPILEQTIGIVVLLRIILMSVTKSINSIR